jgi:hypothetical protein
LRLVHVGAAFAHLVSSDAKIAVLHASTGFGSKATLFRAFTLFTAHTPGYWRDVAATRPWTDIVSATSIDAPLKSAADTDLVIAN